MNSAAFCLFTPSGNSSVLNVTTLQNALATANVTVNTGSSGAQSGDITVANAVTWSSSHSLTLTSARDIVVNANITFGSAHPGVCQFVFCDGSVKGLATKIDLITLTYLATRDGGEVIPDY